jgi:hypothetical protein
MSVTSMIRLQLAVFAVVAGTAPAANGAAWTVEPLPSPAVPSSAYGPELTSVSCPSATACIAVGYVLYKDETLRTVAEDWDGQHWTIQPTPTPAGGGELVGVSCTTATECFAVGSQDHRWTTVRPGHWRTLVERWDGRTWTVQPSPNPSGNSGLLGVSCASAGTCTAVGFGSYLGGTDPGTTLAERWNGHRWTIQHTPTFHSVFTRDGYFTAVSCSSARACFAVGTQGGAERWTGRTWLRQSATRNFEPHGYPWNFNAVSCSSAAFCTALATSSNFSFAERWNGRSWTRQRVPNPSPASLDGSRFSELVAVSCPSTSSCTAVGDFSRATSKFPMGEEFTLAEHWNGARWSIQATPALGSDSIARLAGVTCRSPTLCVAVGQWASAGSPNQTLAERYA